MKPNRSVLSKWFSLSTLIVLAALVLAACQPAAAPTAAPTDVPAPTATSAPTATAEPTMAPATATPAMAEPTIKVADDPKLGKILVDDKGMTLYMYTKDTADTSTCTGGCLANWPALKTGGSPKAGDGVDSSKLGSAALADGSKIVTYNHMPLYYWAKDTKAGDTTGQNVGKVWFVVAPDGTVVKAADATATPAAASNATLMVASSPALGRFLVDGRGMTLYIYTKDEADKSNCAAACLANWPPLLAVDSPKLGDGVDAAKLGTTATADGRKMITYNHMPLYYWVKDTKAGDTTGQNVGKVWFVVAPDGSAVKTAAAVPTATPATAGGDDYGYSKTAAAEPTINVMDDPKLGKILVDGKGMTLYLFKKDTAGKSNCAGDCLVAWPPLVTMGKPILGAGVDATKIGTATLADGKLIVTYAGMPLYYFAKDTKAGDTTGQGVGSVWYIVAP